jgi:hypothetical protein
MNILKYFLEVDEEKEHNIEVRLVDFESPYLPIV